MRTIPAALQTHLQGSGTTLAWCWKATRKDGQIFAFTSNSRDITVSGQLYKANTGFTASQLQWNAQMSVDNLEASGVLSDDAITEADLRTGLWDYALIEIFQVNWAAPTDGILKHLKGRLGDVRSGRLTFDAELRGLLQDLQQSVGRTYGADCDADLGDSRCTVNLAGFTVTGTITGVTSRRAFADSTRTEANDWFTAGKITFTSGANTGFSREVKSYLLAGGALELQIAMPYDVLIGDAYSMHAGCQKRYDVDCRDKFNNVVNHRGFPFVPGSDRMISGR